MSQQQELLDIVHRIEDSSLQTVPNFLTVLLASHNPWLETAVSAMKSPEGVRKILTLMATYQSEHTAEEWALEVSKRIYINEIKTVIQKVHGLHFNAQQATTGNIMEFSLEKIANKFRSMMPNTWTLMQTLLDVHGEARRHAKPLKEAVRYHKQHDPDADTNEPEGDSTSESETEGERKEGGSTQARRRNSAILQIVS